MRSAVNRKFGGSSPPRGVVIVFCFDFCLYACSELDSV